MADIIRSARENLLLLGDMANDAASAVARGFHDFTGAIDIETESQTEYYGSATGVVHIRRHVPEFLGAVLLFGDYVDEDGVVNRTPSDVHMDTEDILGEKVNVRAEVVLGDAFLAALCGTAVTGVIGSRITEDITLKGSQINIAFDLLGTAAAADSATMLERFRINSKTAERVQKASERFVGLADKIDLMQRAGVKYGRPLVRRQPETTFPQHLIAARGRARLAASIPTDVETADYMSRIPAFLRDRAAARATIKKES